MLLLGVAGILSFTPATGSAQSPAPGAAPTPGETAPGDLPVTGDPGLKIAPTRYEETLDPGQPKDGVVDLFNVSREPLTIQPEVENIRMVGEEGALDYYIGDNPFRLHSFVQIDKTPFTLGVGEGRQVKFRITMPNGVFPGGYFGAVLFRIVPPEAPGEGSVIRQSGRVGSLLILNVSGDSDRRGKIGGAAVTRNDFAGEKAFRISYQNTGNTDQRPLGVAYRPKGTLKIKNSLGLTVATRQIEGETVLPGASRKFDAKLNKPLWFGRYTAEISLGPGDEQRADTVRVKFWAVSPVGAFIALASLLALLLGGYFLLRRRRVTPAPPQGASLIDEVAKQQSSSQHHHIHRRENPAPPTPPATGSATADSPLVDGTAPGESPADDPAAPPPEKPDDSLDSGRPAG